MADRKRKAEHSDLGPPAQRAGPSVPRPLASQPSVSRTLAAFATPHPSSLNGLIQKHGRERLYVKPIRWTARHLELLECHFEQQETPGTVQASHLPSSKKLDQVRNAGHAFLVANCTSAKLAAFRDLMKAHGILLPDRPDATANSSSPGQPCVPARRFLSFGFGKKNEPHYIDAVFMHPTTGCVSIGFLSYEALVMVRRLSVCGSTDKKPNPPVDRRREECFRRLEPASKWEDPYVVACLIALAQKECLRRAKEECPPVFEVYLIMTTFNTTRSLYVYTARVTRYFLDRFETPSRYTPSEGLVVSYYCIPLSALESTSVPRRTVAQYTITMERLLGVLRESKRECKSEDELNGGRRADRGGDNSPKQKELE
ncbi:hypothetical protein QBC46DRAFT_352821 [Diplogelasinospora grovesii]|uniref:Uncharacterized protein n=1 Tax=Diplogelasinospora grovesii TaxID=303347 RepID=A0AAN6S6T2_9PEZI|nr:hypothetical protein QBC46DRAFT_352821 [Diplogelasinospora grovesii]